MQVEPAISKAQQRPIGHRYQVLGLRGSGAEASVHLAIDLFTGQEVALKLGPPERLAPEYRRSAALAHPHLARAVSLWHEAGGASLALEYGAEDLTAVRGCAEAVVVRHVAGIARALGYLHRRGIVHGDVKPQNAVLAGPDGARRALLVDLGLSGSEPISRGSLEYAAPEVLEGAAPDAAADLYSLGVTLHELLSGTNPFAAGTPAEVIRAHFESVPPLGASPGVRAVVAKLLAREPRSLYPHADAVIEALAAATGLPLESEGEGLALDQIGMGQFHGREAELARIETAARRAAGGRGAQQIIVGPSGSGRSRLLRAAAIAAELAGLRALHLSEDQGLATLGLWLGLLLGDRARFEPTVAAARKLLAAPCALSPIALVMDGADRADGALRSLLLALASEPAWKQRGLLVVAAASEQLEHSLERIELRPLPTALRKAKIVEALGPRSPWAEGLADLLVRETSGLPGELEESLRDLVARGLLERRGGRWELDVPRAGAAPRRRARGGGAALPDRVRRPAAPVRQPARRGALGTRGRLPRAGRAARRRATPVCARARSWRRPRTHLAEGREGPLAGGPVRAGARGPRPRTGDGRRSARRRNGGSARRGDARRLRSRAGPGHRGAVRRACARRRRGGDTAAPPARHLRVAPGRWTPRPGLRAGGRADRPARRRPPCRGRCEGRSRDGIPVPGEVRPIG